MLDQRARELVREAVRGKSKELDESLHRRLLDIGRRSSQNGQYGSSRMHLSYGNELVTELRHRAQLIFAELQRAIGLFQPISLDTLHKDLLEVFLEELRPQAAGLSQVAQEKLGGGAPFGHRSPGSVQARVNDECTDLSRRYEKVELLAYVEAMKQRSMSAGTSGSGVVVHGNVGVVQTGAYATATVSIGVSDDDKLALMRALELAAAVFTDSRHLAQEHRRQMLGVVEQAKNAAQAETPNPSVLRGMLVVLCESLQTLAAAGPAMAALRAAALPFGIVL